MKKKIIHSLFILLLFSIPILPAAEITELEEDESLLIDAIKNNQSIDSITKIILDSSPFITLIARDRENNTPLMLASFLGRTDLVEMLLLMERNASSVMSLNNNGQSARHLAQNESIRSIILKKEKEFEKMCLDGLSEPTHDHMRNIRPGDNEYFIQQLKIRKNNQSLEILLSSYLQILSEEEREDFKEQLTPNQFERYNVLLKKSS